MSAEELVDLDTSSGNLERLAEIHIARYSNMLRAAYSGASNFRISELRQLLACWEAVRASGHDWEKLTPDQRGEVTDAIWSGE